MSLFCSFSLVFFLVLFNCFFVLFSFPISMARSNKKLALTLYRALMREGRKVELLCDFFTVHVVIVSQAACMHAPVNYFEMRVVFFVCALADSANWEQAVDQAQRNGAGEANYSIFCIMCSESASHQYACKRSCHFKLFFILLAACAAGARSARGGHVTPGLSTIFNVSSLPVCRDIRYEDHLMPTSVT